ncbi:hypothetical protein T492DRAFT_905211 [Pavlovales sp. CCMP2436]|nr:hypothetical protein T492DRAFT_905211 [Pavlovales sp. CCMP2436]
MFPIMFIEPLDHELHYSLGALHSEAGDEQAARAAFEHAVELYQHCPKPHVALGAIAVAADETAAALSHFDEARARAADEEEGSWWEAAVNSALCCQQLAEAEAEAGCAERPWRARLPADVARLRQALVVAPGDERLLGLLARMEAALLRSRGPLDTVPPEGCAAWRATMMLFAARGDDDQDFQDYDDNGCGWTRCGRLWRAHRLLCAITDD